MDNFAALLDNNFLNHGLGWFLNSLAGSITCAKVLLVTFPPNYSLTHPI